MKALLFPDRINLIGIEIKTKFSKLSFFSLVTLTPFTFGAFSQTGRHESKEEECDFTQIK